MRSRKYFYYFDGNYPQDVANMGYNVWDWDASKLDTLFQDSLKTTPVASNSDPVGAWVDGVQGVDAIQATTANKPTYSTGTLNGLPTLGFDGGDILATAQITTSTFAVWIVMRGTGGVWLYNNNDTVNNYQFMLVSGNPAISVNRTATISSKNKTAWGTNSTWQTARQEFNGTHASHKLFVNNSEQSMTNNTIGDPGTGSNTAPLIIGGSNAGTGSYIGNIAQLLIVSPYPTPAIIAQMETYINSKWGIY